jgi:hypothetical protein
MKTTALSHALLGLTLLGLAQPGCATGNEPVIASWIVNTQGVKGSSPDPGLNELAVQITADVTRVSATANSVYVETSGVPSYPTGPFADGNPAYASDLHAAYQIPRVPRPAAGGLFTKVGLGAIGIYVNGIAVFNYADAHSYKNQGVWHQDANVFEWHGFDETPGHPAPLPNATPVNGYVPGQYHHHQSPAALRRALGDDGSHHSPILGFAFDGYPIYGPYGYAKTDGSGGIVRLGSGYRLRNIANRTTLPGGKNLPPSLYGPSLATVPLGGYAEDYEFVRNFGDLDSHNGRFTVTPEYPNGTYAYFLTVDQNDKGVFPYALGDTYYGQVAVQNGIIPDNAVPVP